MPAEMVVNRLPEVRDAWRRELTEESLDDHASFEAFYSRSAGRLVMQLYLVTGDLEEARDCVQEACARAWARWDSLKGTADGPAGWVYTVAYRVAVSRFRRRIALVRLWPRTATPHDVPGPAPDLIAVRDALTVLPHGQRAALVLHYYEGLSVEAIAAVLGLSVSGVKSRLARGRAALAQLLGEGSAR